jgi:iron complex outermembrane recepter protein
MTMNQPALKILFKRLPVAIRSGTGGLFVVFWLSFLPNSCPAQQWPDLTEMSLEDLMNMEVTLATRTASRLSETASAISVISDVEIRRAGVSGIPDAIRLATGMEVASLDANKWAISARGFNSIYSNKTLVLMDGRSLYSPLFSGVFWDSQDVMLEDVDRIEVIRGPGAALWGANAVNGIVNILSKEAKATQGGLVAFGGGTREKGFGSVRYGGKIGEKLYYRVFAKHTRYGGFVDTSGMRTHDDWFMSSGGFRMDWNGSSGNSLTFQGDIHAGDVGQEGKPTLFRNIRMEIPDYRTLVRSGNLNGRFKHRFSETADMDFRVSFDWIERRDKVMIGGEYNTLDADLQHHFRQGDIHEVVWGLGYRVTRDRIRDDLMATMIPDHKTYDILSAFIQDEISLVRNRLLLTVGSKFEHNDFTRGEIQPNLRMLWTLNSRHSIWGAVSRAVRLPDRSDRGFRVNYNLDPLHLSLQGNPQLRSEEVLAWEAGYRLHPVQNFWFSLNGFFNQYKRITIYNIGDMRIQTDPLSILLPFYIDNRMSGTGLGLEIIGDWEAREGLRFHASYAYLDLRLEADGEVRNRYAKFERDLGLEKNIIQTWLISKGGKSPRHSASLRGSWNVTRKVEADVGLRYVDRLPGIEIDRYFGLDCRLGWNVRKSMEAYLVGRDLIGARHREFNEQPSPFGSTLVSRSASAGVRFIF